MIRTNHKEHEDYKETEIDNSYLVCFVSFVVQKEVIG
jgi:hypothetical protein